MTRARARRTLAAILVAGLSTLDGAAAQFMTGRRVDRERAVAADSTAARQLVERVGFDQKLGAALPLDLELRDETGRAVRLGDYFAGKPVLLGLVYYKCPVLCSLVERGLVSGLKPLTLAPGGDFEIVLVSIDPSETPVDAAARKAALVGEMGRHGDGAGWHFLTGEATAVAALADTVGFRYARDPETGQYAHAAGLTVATPDGRLARYLFGVDYAPRDLKLALVEASEGRIGTALDKALLICFRYDAALGKYTAATMRILQIGAVLTLVALATFLVLAFRRERRGRQLAAGGIA